MNDTLFVQFVLKTFLSHKTSPLNKDSFVYGLANGFSDTYDLCKSKGDFYWVDLEMGNRIKSASETIKHCDSIPFPIDRGTAYISCVLMPQIYQAYSWATRYPNVNFIVGGNVVDSGKLQWDADKFPSNLTLYENSVEDYFGVKNFSHKWHIDPPDWVMNDPDHPIFFTYNLNNNCYWGKCNFCQFYGAKRRVRESYDFEFKDVFEANDHYKMICLYSPSISPTEIIKSMRSLPNRYDLFYRMYMRGSIREAAAMCGCFSIYDYLKPELFEPFIGVEFPSRRMINIVKKGIYPYELSEAICMLGEIGTKVTVGLILGWPDLKESDLKELENFLVKIKGYEHLSIKINKLFCRAYTSSHETYKSRGPWKVGPFYQGFNPIVSKEVLEINDQAHRIIERSDITLVSNYKLIRDIEKDPSKKKDLGNKIVGSE